MGIAIYAASARSPSVLACIFCCRRFTSLQQTRLVSQDADHSRRSLCAPLYGQYSTILEGILKHGAFGALSAFQHATPFGLRLSAFQLLPFRPHPAAYEQPPVAIRFYARGEATGQLAEVLTSEGEAGAC